MAKKDFSAMNTGRAETAESSAVMRKLEQGASNKGQQGETTQQEYAKKEVTNLKQSEVLELLRKYYK